MPGPVGYGKGVVLLPIDGLVVELGGRWFDARALVYLAKQIVAAIPSRGGGPLWNEGSWSDVRPEPGLWAFEPHVRKSEIGAKWEELMVIGESDAYWLDDDLPHVVPRPRGSSARG